MTPVCKNEKKIIFPFNTYFYYLLIIHVVETPNHKERPNILYL